MSKKIALIYRNLAGLSGVPNIVSAQANCFIEEGYTVHLLAERVNKRKFDLKKMEHVKIRRLPFFKSKRLKSFASRADRVSRSRYDFVLGHGHNVRQDILSIHNCPHLQHKKMSAVDPVALGPDAFMQDRIFAKRLFEYCIVNSKLMRDEIIGRYAIPTERVQVIYPGYDQQRFNLVNHKKFRQEMRAAWGLGRDEFVIGMATSGVFKLRGVDIAIEAFAALPKAVRDSCRMVVIGNASHKSYFRDQAFNLGIDDRILFIAATEEIECCYAAMDVLVHAARLETFGLVVQEAMASGIPVITNKQVGAAELLSAEAYKQLPDESTVEQLSSQILRMVEDKALRELWAHYGIEAVKNNSFQASFAKTLDLCKKVGL